jgi:hypothetical protein
MTKPTTSEMKTFTLEELGELNVYFGEHGELPHGVEEALLEMATGYHELRLATAETMTKPTTESGAPIEFTLRGYKFRLCLEQWSDGGSREFGWAHGERVAAEHLAAALQANPELRAQVLGAFWGPEDIAENNKRAAELWRAIGEPSLRASLEAAESELALMYSAFLPQHAPKNPREARQVLERLCDYEAELALMYEALAKCRAELDDACRNDHPVTNTEMVRRLRELLAFHEQVERASATGDQEAAAVEPEKSPTLGKDHCYDVDGMKLVVRGGSIEDFKRAALAKPPEAPKLQGGPGPDYVTVDALVAALRKLANYRDSETASRCTAWNNLADELERGRQR